MPTKHWPIYITCRYLKHVDFTVQHVPSWVVWMGVAVVWRGS